MDNGSFHKALLLDWADHVIPIYLPAYSPELNPIERLWEHTWGGDNQPKTHS